MKCFYPACQKMYDEIMQDYKQHETHIKIGNSAPEYNFTRRLFWNIHRDMRLNYGNTEDEILKMFDAYWKHRSHSLRIT